MFFPSWPNTSPFSTEATKLTKAGGAELLRDVFGVGDEIVVGVEGQDADLFGREPDREIAGIMFDQETDEPLVRAEWRAMKAQRRFLDLPDRKRTNPKTT